MRIGGAKERLSVRVRLEEKEWLQQEASRRRLSIGELVRRIIGECRSGAQSGSANATQEMVPATQDDGFKAVSDRDKKAIGSSGWDDD